MDSFTGNDDYLLYQIAKMYYLDEMPQDAIAKKVRFLGGGLRFCKAMGVELKDRGIVQVSMNLTDYTKAAVCRAHEMVRMEAQRYGVSVVGAEVIGLVPMKALIDCAEYYLGIENFSMDQVLESRIME